MSSIALRSLALWLVILFFAVFNGWLREALLVPVLGLVPGMVTSGALLCVFIIATVYLLLPWTRLRSSREAALIGAGWLILTVAFEFSLGLSRGEPLSVILEAYTFKDGNLWLLVLTITALSPWLAAKARRLF